MIPGNAIFPLIAGIVLMIVGLAWIICDSSEEDEDDCRFVPRRLLV